MKYRRFVQIAVAILIAIGSIPLAYRAASTAFGGGTLLLIPICCVALWLSLSAVDRNNRVGWFVFAAVVTILLPSDPWWGASIHNVLTFVQNYLMEFRSLYRLSETVAVISTFVVPVLVSCVIGSLAARFARKRLAFVPTCDKQGSSNGFTLRGLFIATAVIAGVTVWISSHVLQFNSREQAKHAVFLELFNGSFTSGEVELLDDPRLVGQLDSHINHYRISAPIRKNGQKLWAVWTYWVDENIPHTVSNFGYAEAATEDALPTPFAEYLAEGPMFLVLVDGAPPQEKRLQLREAEASVTVDQGQIVDISVLADWPCELEVRPFSAILTRLPPPKVAPPTGIVSWEVKIDPKFRGARIEYEVTSRVNNSYRAETIAGVVTLRETK